MNPQPKENNESGSHILFAYYFYVIPQILSLQSPTRKKDLNIQHEKHTNQGHHSHEQQNKDCGHSHEKNQNSQNIQVLAKKYTVKAELNGKSVGQINHPQNTFGNSNNQRNNKIKINAGSGQITIRALVDDKQYGSIKILIDPIVSEIQSSNGPVEKQYSEKSNKHSFSFIVRGEQP